ncbi:DNA internalization-related competence protein ComEC/Rec2 [Alkalihalophilus lindianensis]|uniref:DNA internalization-related competence protein ComEC/Rec2 n=1 Tax=Alkalihalophilus lindianensis TaxID=1630542 RepID=A0ABU3X585_9BACI|nr:DNA internalization-related competence protein ComEC/Rec2 [Alkalihalophilus lindianensis]MDV2683059.1 DNA internalization-related competence protein ComEC/Rec2 [Alkalihalophilus lindianensis]
MLYSVIVVMSAMLGLVFILRGPSFFFYVAIILLLIYLLVHAKHFRVNGMIAVLVFSLYAGFAWIAESSNTTHLKAGEQQIEGHIHSLVKIDGDAIALKVKSVHGEILQLHGFIESEQQQAQLKQLLPGDRCIFTATLSPPSSPTNFYQFNYKQYLYQQQIHWVLTPELQKLNCVRSEKSLFYRLQTFRAHQIKRIEELVHPDASGIIIALVFGERMYVEQDVLEAYQRLGIIHLLAVSGLHVGLIIAAMYGLFIRIGLTRERTLESLCLFLPLYIIIAGAAPSVIRASLMTLIVMVFLRFKWNIPPLFAIAIVFLVYLALNPYALFQLGFQLSFLVSFSLLVSAEVINKRYSSWLAKLVAVTILAQLVSLPLLLNHFYQFSLLTLLVNILYIPFISFIVLPLSFLGVLMQNVIPIELNLPIQLVTVLIPPVHHGLVQLDAIELFNLITGKPHSIPFILYFLVTLIGLLVGESGKDRWWIVPLVGYAMVAGVQWTVPIWTKEAIVTMLDVGQGDSFVIELPRRGEVYVIDTGGTIRFNQGEEWRLRQSNYDVGREVVLSYLKAKGIRRIDKLILTHGHMDHIGGAIALVGEVAIDQLLYSAGEVEGEFEKLLLRELQHKGTEIIFVKKGNRWTSYGSQFAVLSPQGHEQGLNDRSIVLYADIEGVSFLFTGDLEEEGERRLLNTYPDLSVDVLKIAHHGSKTSTTDNFLLQLQPSFGLISAGRNNRFNHPHIEVTERLDEQHVKIIRTDKHGAIQLYVKNGSMKMHATEYKKAE